jgi:hypothetical protein
MGNAHARLRDGAQHPGHSRRRRQPRLFRRPLPRLLDLRCRFRRAAGRRSESARACRHALFRRRANDTRRPHRRLDRLLHAAPRILGASRRQILRHHAEGHAARVARATSSTCS